jgi:hypothetical protein
MTARPVAEQCIALDVSMVTGDARVGRLTWRNAAPGFYLIYERRAYEVALTFPDGAVQTVGIWREGIHNGGHRTFFYLEGRRARRLWLAPDRVTHHAVTDPRPTKRALLQPLGNQHQAGAVPQQQLHAIGSLGPEPLIGKSAVRSGHGPAGKVDVRI